MSIETDIGIIPVYAQLPDGNTAIYPQTIFVDTTGTEIATVPLASIGDGAYYVSVKINTPGYYLATTTIFSDSEYTTPNLNYGQSSEDYRINDEAGRRQALANLILSQINNTHQYANKISTAYDPVNNIQSLIAWTEKDGQLVTSASNCTVTIKNTSGSTIWTATLSAPNADGIFIFTSGAALAANNNFYVIVTTTTDAATHTSCQSFFTVV